MHANDQKKRKLSQPKKYTASERSSLSAVPATPSEAANAQALSIRHARAAALAKAGLARVVALEPARFPGVASNGDSVERSQNTLGLGCGDSGVRRATEAATLGCKAIAESICKTLRGPEDEDKSETGSGGAIGKKSHVLSLHSRSIEQDWNSHGSHDVMAYVYSPMPLRGAQLVSQVVASNAVRSAIVKKAPTQGSSQQTPRLNKVQLVQATAAEAVSTVLTLATARKLFETTGTCSDPATSRRADQFSQMVLPASGHQTTADDELVVTSSTAMMLIHALPTRLRQSSFLDAMKKIALDELTFSRLNQVVPQRGTAVHAICEHIVYNKKDVNIWAAKVLLQYCLAEPKLRSVIREAQISESEVCTATIALGYAFRELDRRKKIVSFKGRQKGVKTAVKKLHVLVMGARSDASIHSNNTAANAKVEALRARWEAFLDRSKTTFCDPALPIASSTPSLGEIRELVQTALSEQCIPTAEVHRRLAVLKAAMILLEEAHAEHAETVRVDAELRRMLFRQVPPSPPAESMAVSDSESEPDERYPTTNPFKITDKDIVEEAESVMSKMEQGHFGRGIQGILFWVRAFEQPTHRHVLQTMISQSARAAGQAVAATVVAQCPTVASASNALPGDEAERGADEDTNAAVLSIGCQSAVKSSQALSRLIKTTAEQAPRIVVWSTRSGVAEGMRPRLCIGTLRSPECAGNAMLHVCQKAPRLLNPTARESGIQCVWSVAQRLLTPLDEHSQFVPGQLEMREQCERVRRHPEAVCKAEAIGSRMRLEQLAMRLSGSSGLLARDGSVDVNLCGVGRGMFVYRARIPLNAGHVRIGRQICEQMVASADAAASRPISVNRFASVRLLAAHELDVSTDAAAHPASNLTLAHVVDQLASGVSQRTRRGAPCRRRLAPLEVCAASKAGRSAKRGKSGKRKLDDDALATNETAADEDALIDAAFRQALNRAARELDRDDGEDGAEEGEGGDAEDDDDDDERAEDDDAGETVHTDDGRFPRINSAHTHTTLENDRPGMIVRLVDLELNLLDDVEEDAANVDADERLVSRPLESVRLARVSVRLDVAGDRPVRIVDLARRFAQLREQVGVLTRDGFETRMRARALLLAATARACELNDVARAVAAGAHNAAVAGTRRPHENPDLNLHTFASVYDCVRIGHANVPKSFASTPWAGSYPVGFDLGTTAAVGVAACTQGGGFGRGADGRNHGIFLMSQTHADELAVKFASTMCMPISDDEFADVPAEARGIPHGLVPGLQACMDDVVGAMELARVVMGLDSDHSTCDSIQVMPYTPFAERVAPFASSVDETAHLLFRAPEEAPHFANLAFSSDTTLAELSILDESFVPRQSMLRLADNAFETPHLFVMSFYAVSALLAQLAAQLVPATTGASVDAGIAALFAACEAFHADEPADEPADSSGAPPPPLLPPSADFLHAADACVLLCLLYPRNTRLARPTIQKAWADAPMLLVEEMRAQLARGEAPVGARLARLRIRVDRVSAARAYWARIARKRRGCSVWEHLAPLLKRILELDGRFDSPASTIAKVRAELQTAMRAVFYAHSEDGIKPAPSSSALAGVRNMAQVKTSHITPNLVGRVVNGKHCPARGPVIGAMPMTVQQVCLLLLGARLVEDDDNGVPLEPVVAQHYRNEGGICIRPSSVSDERTKEGGRRSEKSTCPTSFESGKLSWGTAVQRELICFEARTAYRKNIDLTLELMRRVCKPLPQDVRDRGSLHIHSIVNRLRREELAGKSMREPSEADEAFSAAVRL